MNLFDLLRSDGSIVVNKALAHKIGLHEAIVYSELVSLSEYWKRKEQMLDSEWFYCTIDNLQKNTTLKRSVQDKAIKNLQKLKLIEVKRMGIPAKRYFKVTDEIYKIIVPKQHYNQIVGLQQSSMQDMQHSSLSFNNIQESGDTTANNTRVNNTNNNKDNIYSVDRKSALRYDWINDKDF